MSGATRSVQQPLARGSILAAAGVAVAIVAAAAAMAWGSANLGRATQVAAPAPAPIYAPAARDLGSRDQGPASVLHVKNAHDGAGFGSRTRVLGNQLKDDQAFVSSTPALGYHGFGNPADKPAAGSSGANSTAPTSGTLVRRPS